MLLKNIRKDKVKILLREMELMRFLEDINMLPIGKQFNFNNQLSKTKNFCNEMQFTGQKAKMLFLHGKKLSKKK